MHVSECVGTHACLTVPGATIYVRVYIYVYICI